MALPQIVTKGHEHGPLMLIWPNGQASGFDLTTSTPSWLSYTGKVTLPDGFVLNVEVKNFKATVKNRPALKKHFAAGRGPAQAVDDLLDDIGDAFEFYFNALPAAVPGQHGPMTAPIGTALLLNLPGQPPFKLTLIWRSPGTTSYKASGLFSNGLVMPLKLNYFLKGSKVEAGMDGQIHQRRQNTFHAQGLMHEIGPVAENLVQAFQNFLTPAVGGARATADSPKRGLRHLDLTARWRPMSHSPVRSF